jgi:hypothetical protein
MKNHKENLEFAYLVSLHEAVKTHVIEGQDVSFENLIDKKRRDIFKRHIGESFKQQAKNIFEKNKHLHHHAQTHEKLIAEVIEQTNNYVEEKQGACSQLELLQLTNSIIQNK